VNSYTVMNVVIVTHATMLFLT